jgi:hypothetical protein
MMRLFVRLRRSNLSRVPGAATNAAARSSGMTSASMSSRAVQEPFAFAVSIARNPGSRIRPAAMRRSTLALLICDQPLFGFRGEKYCMYLRLSIGLALLSIHPKQSASSTASFQVMLG